ncbi:hypothetical protein Tco_0237457 [Tanacetum coccineum]
MEGFKATNSGRTIHGNAGSDAFDSDCDEAPLASVVLMAKLSSYDSKIHSEVPIHDNYLDNHLIDQNVQEMQHEEACTKTTNERCSTVLLNELPSKEKDHRSFTSPCQVLEKHKEAEDLAADHLSRFENPHMEVLTEREIADKFSNKHLMALKSKSNNDEQCCVAGSETLEIQVHCHSGPTGGHHSANVTAKKVYEAEFYRPSVFKDVHEYVR